MASLLWPESDSEGARGSLQRTLHKIRIAFQANVICADRTSLILAPSLAASIDTHEFEAACDAGELEKAGQLSSGDFLEGLSIEGCPAFDEWAFFRREALRSRLVQVLERQIERALMSSNPAAGIPAAVRLVGLDPLRDGTAAPDLRLHALRGPCSGRTSVRKLCTRACGRAWGDARSADQGVADPAYNFRSCTG